MTAEPPTAIDSATVNALAGTKHRSGLILLGICTVFVLLRFPLMYRQQGGQDEEWYAVPGYTIVQCGVPRIPFAPARDPASVFYKADEVLFALPPAYFYWQALFYWVLPPGHFTGRLASGAAGLLAIVLVYQIGRRFYEDEATALWGAALYSLSRVFYFPATCARPDITCAAIGLAVLLAIWQWRTTGRMRWLFAGGALVGLGMLTHPFAVVYGVQAGIWVLLGRGWRRRLGHAVLLTGTALLVFAAWTPLIMLHPEAFRVQFFNNVLGKSGPGLLQRLAFPWEALLLQSRLFVERAGIWQAALAAVGLAAATAMDWRSDRRGRGAMLALTWSSVYLLIACLGRHPTKEYWCYPGGLLALCFARTAVSAFRQASQWLGRVFPKIPAPLLAWSGGVLLLASMAPGSGIRTWLVHLQHWSEVEYSSPQFVSRLLKELPEEGLYLVDRAYVFDFYVAGRRTLVANNTQTFFKTDGASYHYLIAGPCSLQSRVPQDLGAVFVRTIGNPDDLFACFADIYVPPSRRREGR